MRRWVGRTPSAAGVARAEAIAAVSSWIENVYNRRRRHSALGQISPVAFEHRLTTVAAEAA